jgi:hypothetical protein
MPLVRCEKDGRPGWKWGDENISCFTYIPGDPVSEEHARSAALRQAQAIESKKKGDMVEYE